MSDQWYRVKCQDCGWVGSTEHCGGGATGGDDYDGPFCPHCKSENMRETDEPTYEQLEHQLSTALAGKTALEQKIRESQEQQIKRAVDRFLGWRLPANFNPDAGISFIKPEILYPRVLYPDQLWPTGTNLFDASQAQEMFEHCLAVPIVAKEE